MSRKGFTDSDKTVSLALVALTETRQNERKKPVKAQRIQKRFGSEHRAVLKWTESIETDLGFTILSQVYVGCLCGQAFVATQEVHHKMAHELDLGASAEEREDGRLHFGVKGLGYLVPCVTEVAAFNKCTVVPDASLRAHIISKSKKVRRVTKVRLAAYD